MQLLWPTTSRRPAGYMTCSEEPLRKEEESIFTHHMDRWKSEWEGIPLRIVETRDRRCGSKSNWVDRKFRSVDRKRVIPVNLKSPRSPTKTLENVKGGNERYSKDYPPTVAWRASSLERRKTGKTGMSLDSKRTYQDNAKITLNPTGKMTIKTQRNAQQFTSSQSEGSSRARKTWNAAANLGIRFKMNIGESEIRTGRKEEEEHLEFVPPDEE